MKIDSRNVADLHPYMQALCKEHIKRAEAKLPRAKVITTSTLRNQERQTELYSYGRTDKTKQIVTNAKLVKAHGFGLAYDLAIIIDGVAVYKQSQMPKNYPYTCEEAWNIVGLIGEQLGLEWAKRWKSFSENCHFQIIEGITTEQLHKGKRPSIWNKKPLKFDNKPNTKSPLEILKSKNIISDIDKWSDFSNGKVEVLCVNMKHLFINFYKYYSGKDDYIQALNFAVDKKIISDKTYWQDKCVRNEVVESEYIKIVVERMASEIEKTK